MAAIASTSPIHFLSFVDSLNSIMPKTAAKETIDIFIIAKTEALLQGVVSYERTKK